jgi:diguanylate cyclase (GGDEF)-like protein
MGEHDGIQDDIRQHTSSTLLGQLDLIAADAAAIFPHSGSDALDRDYAERIGRLLIELLAAAVGVGEVDAHQVRLSALRQVAAERALTIEQLFSFAYLTERTALDELALDDTAGATTEAWPLVAQLVRRASFEVLAALASRAQSDAGSAAVIDPLTTLHTRSLFDTVLSKEADRAGRFGYGIALIVFDVDHLAALNEQHGSGVGDRVLERVGILIRQYFRQHDWVARYGDDAISVLLTRTDADHADELADKVRATIEERLVLTDHRSDQARAAVTISAGVVRVAGAAGTLIDPERLRLDAEAAVGRAKERGRNRVESVIAPTSATRTLPRS